MSGTATGPALADTPDQAIVEAAIGSLVARYAKHADALDAPGIVSLFAADGTLIVAGNAYQGHEAISGWMAKVAGSVTFRGRHIVSNLVIEWRAADPDAATATADMIFVARTEAGAPLGIIAAARYEDRFVRSAEGWRFAQREIIFA